MIRAAVSAREWATRHLNGNRPELFLSILAAMVLLSAKDNSVFLSLGYPGTTGIYYERNIRPVVIGVGPGLLFPLLTLPDPSYNPDLYLGYSVLGISDFRANIDIHAMYFYKFDKLDPGLRGDLILVGPDLAMQFNPKHLFTQIQLGTRSSFHRWFGAMRNGRFSFYQQMLSITFSGGIGF